MLLNLVIVVPFGVSDKKIKLVADITLANKEGFDAHLAKKLIPCGIGK